MSYPSIICRVRTFLRREDGPTAVEYAVMLALIVVICLASITKIGKDSKKVFKAVETSLKTSS